MSKDGMQPPRSLRSLLLGVGFDGNDGHRRITRGDNFYLVGGSQGTHDRMVDTSMNINEELARRCKTLDELSLEEWREIARKLKLYKP